MYLDGTLTVQCGWTDVKRRLGEAVSKASTRFPSDRFSPERSVACWVRIQLLVLDGDTQTLYCPVQGAYVSNRPEVTICKVRRALDPNNKLPMDRQAYCTLYN